MKFIHIGDLHLGKRMNNFSLFEDQRHALLQIIEAAERERIDALIIAGDVYQKASPNGEAMTLFSEFITSICALGAKVFVISGNHDSDSRISLYSDLMTKSGVYLAKPFDGRLQTVSIEDEYGSLDVFMLPFIKPANVKRLYPDAQIDSYQEAMRVVLGNSPMAPGRRSLLICHQFITGAEMSDSEEHTVGGLDNIDADLFNMFDYVALGHIHKPQKVGRQTVRYSGSPLKYSFSEAGHKKSFVVCEMRDKGEISIKTVPITPLRDVREVEGSLEDIMAMDYSEDYIHVTVTDELVPPDARVTVSAVFPNMMKFSIRNSRTKLDKDILADETLEDRSPIDLFCDFYRLQNNDELPGEDHLTLLKEIIEEVEDKRNEAC